MVIYIIQKGQQTGPFSLLEAQDLLRAGTVSPHDYGWHDGLPDWLPMQQIPGLVGAGAIPEATPSEPVLSNAPKVEPPPHVAAQPAGKGGLWQKLGPVFGAIALVAFKLKALIFPLLKTGLSMLLVIYIYSLAFGWKFAAALIVLIFVHEMGHVLAARWLGYKVSAPLFIPFIGASILMKENPRDAWTEALMGYGGPLLGCLGTWATFLMADALEIKWLIGACSVSFLINIYNLIPIPPLDGGRICAAISRWFWILGLILLLLSLFYFKTGFAFYLVILILIAAFPRFKESLFDKPAPGEEDYYETHLSKRLTMAVAFIALLLALMAGYDVASTQLASLWYTE